MWNFSINLNQFEFYVWTNTGNWNLYRWIKMDMTDPPISLSTAASFFDIVGQFIFAFWIYFDKVSISKFHFLTPPLEHGYQIRDTRELNTPKQWIIHPIFTHGCAPCALKMRSRKPCTRPLELTLTFAFIMKCVRACVCALACLKFTKMSFNLLFHFWICVFCHTMYACILHIVFICNNQTEKKKTHTFSIENFQQWCCIVNGLTRFRIYTYSRQWYFRHGQKYTELQFEMNPSQFFFRNILTHNT